MVAASSWNFNLRYQGQRAVDCISLCQEIGSLQFLLPHDTGLTSSIKPSLIAIHPFDAGHEAMLTFLSPQTQQALAAPTASATSIFLHIRGQLFTRINLDGVEPNLARFIEQLEFHEPSGKESELIMMYLPSGVFLNSVSLTVLSGEHVESRHPLPLCSQWLVHLLFSPFLVCFYALTCILFYLSFACCSFAYQLIIPVHFSV
jgi:hypothetical protein